ncbi:MAG: putative mycofactocin radical SAM maturase MftC [Candidatus Omnitrophica bacterium]|nr:putative mycofactocin radical SAM maturase MftC [Candidatus Omnitrophota bacterium]
MHGGTSHPHSGHPGGHPILGRKYDHARCPFLVIWEATRACDLACVHCRANAIPEPPPGELTTAEARALIDDVSAMGTPIFIFSGGDPLKRPDLPELIRHARSRGLRTGAIPAAGASLTADRLRPLAEAGLDQVAFSLDAATAEAHDSFRRVEGVFDRTLRMVQAARGLGLAVQINSLVNVHNGAALDELIHLVEGLPIVFWEVFFLVPTGRGSELSLLSADKFEQAFAKLYELDRRAAFVVKITEGQHYRRYRAEREAADSVKRLPVRAIGAGPMGINSGKGFMFVSSTGEVMPSGFLPLVAGNVRSSAASALYRDSELFRRLRDTSLLKGRCGICAYKDVCGGSRARAYAMTGDYLAEDPCCAYDPRAAGDPGGITQARPEVLDAVRDVR